MTSDLPSIATAPLPQSYDAAKQALAGCARLDECKGWTDKAQALASYARQARDDTLLKLATRIQARAVRRAGELLQEFDGRGGDRSKKDGTVHSAPTQRQAAEDAGMSERQVKTAVRVANVPQQAFDAAVEGDDPPTVTALAEMGKQAKPPLRPVPEGFQQATKLLGTVRRFAAFCREHAPELVAGGVLAEEAAELRQQVAAIDRWLDRLVDELEDNGGQPVRPRIIDAFADGKWHALKTIAARIGEPEDVVKQALDILARGQPRDVKCERKRVGTSWSYRLFPIRQDRAVSSLELAEKLGPIIAGLAAEGRKNMATMSPNTVAKLAHELKTLIDAWVR